MKILLLDIETAPHMAAVWGLWGENIPLDRLLTPGYTLCWAAKWLGDSEIHFDSILSGPKTMARRIHKLMSKADVIVHYNGNKFDIPTLNREFLLMGLTPPAPSQQVDLLQTARRRFRLASNKLDFVAKQLGFSGKEKHKGFQLWLDCMAKDPEAFAQMASYNKQDVIVLEQVYRRLLPWIKGHPSHAVYADAKCCPNCGSTSAQARGWSMTKAFRFRRFQCLNCGTWYRSSKSEKRHSDRVVGVA